MDANDANDESGTFEIPFVLSRVKMRVVNDNYKRRCELLRIVDGDTMIVRIDLGFATSVTETIRLWGLDTPEQRGPERAAGEFVTAKVQEWVGDIKGVVLESREFHVDKYQRVIGVLWVGGQSLNRWLLDRGYAWPTDSSGSVIGVRDVSALAIPQGIQQQVREAMV